MVRRIQCRPHSPALAGNGSMESALKNQMPIELAALLSLVSLQFLLSLAHLGSLVVIDRCELLYPSDNDMYFIGVSEVTSQ